jgi:hypothetical protein
VESRLWRGIRGGCLVIVGLFTRTFQFGADHLAFHLTDILGLQTMLTGIDGWESSGPLPPAKPTTRATVTTAPADRRWRI